MMAGALYLIDVFLRLLQREGSRVRAALRVAGAPERRIDKLIPAAVLPALQPAHCEPLARCGTPKAALARRGHVLLGHGPCARSDRRQRLSRRIPRNRSTFKVGQNSAVRRHDKQARGRGYKEGAMSFRLRIEHVETRGRETVIRGRLIEGCYFGPQTIRVKDTMGNERKAPILAHSLIEPK